MKGENWLGVWRGWLGPVAGMAGRVPGRILLLCWMTVVCSGLLGGILDVSTACAQAYRLPDTGQDKCYDGYGNEITCPQPGKPFYGQDAQYKGPQPAFRDNGDGTVSDLNTGLVWQKGDSQNGQYRDWQQAVDYCASLDLGGHTDWRLPSKKELMSIVDYGRSYPAINTAFFPDCRSGYYWSSRTYADYPYYAWGVYFGYGYVYWDD